MRFIAFEQSLHLVSSLRPLMPRIKRWDAKLEDQIRRAATSVSLNLAEGSRRTGNDRTNRFRIAAGSAEEVRAGVRLCLEWGYLKESSCNDLLEVLDRLLRLTHGLTKK